MGAHLRPDGDAGGSIPAWAGEPRRLLSRRTGRTVYPRVGGGTNGELSSIDDMPGLSPRGRGNLHRPRQSFGTGGSIPAWAGEPTRPSNVTVYSTVYPRVGGGTQRQVDPVRLQGGLSPRGRGNRGLVGHYVKSQRSIPAWAGEPRSAIRAPLLSAVYPRVGGGTPRRDSPPSSHTGLSPRGRGNPMATFAWLNLQRSIPAWAGEPATWGA